MGNNNKILYALECGHGAPGPDTLVNGSLICAWHGDAQKIESVIIHEWCGKCRTCTFIRWAGLSRHNADLFAAGHSRRNPTHIVGREYLANPNAVRTAQKMREWQAK
jgi:hypothetical protein